MKLDKNKVLIKEEHIKMKKKTYIALILVSVIISCFANKNKNKGMSIVLSISPSGGGEFGYVIAVEKNVLKVMTKELIIKDNVIVFGKVKEIKEKKLSPQELDTLKEYITKLKTLNVNFADAGLRLDTWVFDFVVDGKELGKVNSFQLSEPSTPKDINKIIKFLISLSPLKIDLHGFS